MKVLGKNTTLSRDEVFGKAKSFFEGRFNLTLQKEQTQCCITFANNLGFVTVEVVNNDSCREVTVRTREWETSAEEFLQNL